MNQQPASLYFDIPEGEFADLEVIARTSIAWNALVKEVGFILDPSAEIQVQFVSSAPGSAFINNLTTAIVRTAKGHPFVAGPLIAIATTFALAPAAHFGEDATVAVLAKMGHVHEEDDSYPSADEIARGVLELQRNELAQQHKQELYKQPQRDERIIGFGIGPVYDVRPPLVIPRAEFPGRSGGGETVAISPEVKYDDRLDYPVVIVRSYSKAEERMWRFNSAMGEFSAKMKDREFLEAIRTGHTGIEIGEGVEIRIDLKTRLQKTGDVWTVAERTVERVYVPRARQKELQFATN